MFTSFFRHQFLVLATLTLGACTSSLVGTTADQPIRFASYNVALFRAQPEDLAADLVSKQDTQIQNIAAVVQHVRPDVLALMEFDYDPTGKLIKDFNDNYLTIGQHGQEGLSYSYMVQIPSNTGVPSGYDLNNDGKTALPDDAFGYGAYEGQYAFALLSKYPIKTKEIRSLQKFHWSDMPDAKVPLLEDEGPFYSNAEWKDLRLSSKNHVDIPVVVSANKDIHIILAHPTPPVFDGDEDRNGKRNYDEIRLISDYVSGAEYIVDDKGVGGGIEKETSFVVMGDLNADPKAGDSYPGAISQLLENPRVHQESANGSLIPKNSGGTEAITRKQPGADPQIATSFFGLRIDYVLPSANGRVLETGVFWPAPGEALYDQVRNRNASDHLLVFVDAQF